MTQITIHIDNAQDASFIKKFLSKFDSVTFETKRKRKSSYEKACDDIDAGRVVYCNGVKDMFDKLNS